LTEYNQIRNGINKQEKQILGLIGDCGKGDEKRLKEFFELFSQDIYNFPIKIFHLDKDSASDFYLYAFDRLRSGKRFRSFKGKSSFKTWFYSVLRNLVIDWMRTIKILPTVSIRKIDSEGKEYQSIENEPDPHAKQNITEIEMLEQFKKCFSEIRIEARVIFKLSFLYYLNLDPDEIKYISSRKKISTEEVVQRLLEIKDILCKKYIQNLEAEDKLTSIYQNILELKLKKKKLLENNPRQKLHIRKN
jgi:RNA polymerase sigma factor (sigma-70 family)